MKSDLQQAHSDLLFSVQCAGARTLLYLLFEHQTSVDPAMALRMLHYVAEILASHEREHGLPLPPVVPFVLHQGPAGWGVSARLEDMFVFPPGTRDAFLPFVPKLEHGLLDLSRFDPSSDEDNARLRVVLNLMKAARERRVLEFFEWLGKSGASVAVVLEDDLLRLCMVYAWNSDDELDVENVARHLLSEPKLQRSAMTIVEKLMTKGREEGREAGREEGREEGVWIGKLLFLEELMGMPLSDRAELAAMPLEALRARFGELEARYRQAFKKGA